MPSATKPFRVCERYDPPDALERLRRIRADGRMRVQPVASLTRSEDRGRAAGDELAASLVPKTFGVERFVEAVRQLGCYRLVLAVSLPPQEWR
jgi:hypothetical protein